MINLTKNSKSIPTYSELRASWLAGRRRPSFGAKLEVLKQKKMVHIFHFLQSDMVFGIVNPFSWIVKCHLRLEK